MATFEEEMLKLNKRRIKSQIENERLMAEKEMELLNLKHKLEILKLRNKMKILERIKEIEKVKLKLFKKNIS